ncbi:MAG: alpha/beta hydrolase fold domain-containing protein [Bacteroidales bacterium]
MKRFIVKHNVTLRSMLFCCAISVCTFQVNAQGYDADSVFMNDAAAIDFFENFEPDRLDNIPDWDEIIVYKDMGWIQLTLSMYHGKIEGENQPCILFFHGGGWKTRAINQYKQYAYYFSELGFTVASVKYRVFNDSSVVEPCDEIADANSAIRYVRHHATSLGIDPDRIVVGGMSSGGHLASATAFIEECEEVNEFPGVSFKPNALILQNPLIDLSEDGWKEGHEYLGDTWELLSPLHNIGQDCNVIPSIIMSGSSDNITPIHGMRNWDSEYKSRGCPNELYVFDGRGHGFGNYNEIKSGPGHRDFIYCLYMMQSFLSANGFCDQCTETAYPVVNTENTKWYPNPATDQLVIETERNMKSIMIYGLTGRAEEIIEVDSRYRKLNLTGFSRGVRLFRIQYTNGETESRIIYII